MHQIGVELIPGIGPFGKDTCWVKLSQGEGRRGSKFLLPGACEIQVEPEECMIGDVPECCGFRWLWVVWVLAPKASIPMRAGTGEQGVFEHVDRRAELLPEG